MDKLIQTHEVCPSKQLQTSDENNWNWLSLDDAEKI
jgi:hypothetical protein